MVHLWPRTSFERSESSSIVDVLLFSDSEFPRDLQVGAEHGLPDGYEWPDSFGFARFDRKRAGWENVEPALRGLPRAEADLQIPQISSRLDHVQCALSMIGEHADAPNLAHLQATWALACYAQSLGAFAMFDLPSESWHDIRNLPDHATTEFDLGREVAFIQECEPDHDFGVVMQTRGLAKFARADLVMCHLPEDRISAAREILWSLAFIAANGERLLPGRPRALARDQVFNGAARRVCAQLGFEPVRMGSNAPKDLRLYDQGIVVVDTAEAVRVLFGA